MTDQTTRGGDTPADSFGAGLFGDAPEQRPEPAPEPKDAAPGKPVTEPAAPGDGSGADEPAFDADLGDEAQPARAPRARKRKRRRDDDGSGATRDAARDDERPPRRERGDDRDAGRRDERAADRDRRSRDRGDEPVRVDDLRTDDARTDDAPAAGGFARFGLGPRIERGIVDAGYRDPRPIQDAAIAETMEGRDILGLAQTGTGKTAAFVLPILHRLTTTKTRGSAPRVLIVAPTRELVSQIHGEVQALGRHTPVRSMTVFGGVSANPQLKNLRQKPQVIVACPGRLLDLEQQGALRLDHVEVLVLDEADHMFDMGFLPDVRRILGKLPKTRQNLLFSATMPREIRKLTKDVLRDPHVVELNHAAPVETIEHALYPVHHTRKESLLRHLIDDPDFRTAIVFTRTKHRAKNLARKLDRDGHHAVALQGNMSQPQRDRAMAGFKDGTYDILVATDIAARGIDVAGVSHVVNFDVPNTPEAYMHRIGRTGRSEREGKAFTFVTGEDFDQVKAIERKLGVEIPRVKLREFAQTDKDAPRVGGQGGGGRAGHGGSRGGGGRARVGGGGRGGGGGGRGRGGSGSRGSSSGGGGRSRGGGGGGRRRR